MKKSISLYQRLKFFYFCPVDFTECGVGVLTGPCIKLRVANTAATQMGEAAFETLWRSGAIVPHPEDWDSLPPSPVLATAGVKNWSTFSRCATCLEIDMRDDTLLLTPMRYEGRLNYTSQGDELHVPATVTATELGEAIQQGLALCR